MTQLLMPQATAVWLVDNTSLTFKQIAELCGMHPLEIQGIAEGEVATNIVGQDPVLYGQIDAEEIERCIKDATATIQLRKRVDLPKTKQSKAHYTPVAKRQDKPAGILYLTKQYPHLADAQIVRLIGTTKQTISSVREGTHRMSEELEPKDPVMLGLCDAKLLNVEIEKANVKAAALEKNLASARAELAIRENDNSAEPNEM